MHICTKYCTEKAHAHSDASMTINGHNIHQNLKRAVERDSQSESTKFRQPFVSGQLVRPSIISHVDTSKKRNSNKFHGINSPLFCFYATGQSLDVGTLCKATLWTLCWRLRLRGNWTVGGFLSAPKIPFQKLGSDHSLPLPRFSPTSITYAESYAH